MLIGERLKKARITKKLSQLELGERLKISDVSISLYETEKREPTLDKLTKLCEILDVTPNYLLGYEKLYISETDENYKVHMSNDEMEFIKEIRKKPNLYKKVVTEPKRLVEIIDRNIIN